MNKSIELIKIKLKGKLNLSENTYLQADDLSQK